MRATTSTNLSIALAAALWQAAASGQAIYRCGDRYSDQPCSGAAPLALQDSRTPDQQKQAQDATRRMEEQASSLEKARRKAEEARPQGTKPTVVTTPAAQPKNPPASQPPKTAKSKAAPEHFTARSLQPPPGKKKTTTKE